MSEEFHTQILRNQKAIMKSLQLIFLDINSDEEVSNKDLKIEYEKLEARVLETKELI